MSMGLPLTKCRGAPALREGAQVEEGRVRDRRRLAERGAPSGTWPRIFKTDVPGMRSIEILSAPGGEGGTS